MVRSRLAAVAASATLCAAAGATVAQAATYPVTAGPPTRVAAKQLDFDRFFNSIVTVHVGDKVRWAMHGFHTVTFLAPGQKIPALFVPGSGQVSGVNDAAGLPMWFNGTLPNLIFNPAAAFPAGPKAVTGKVYINSGVPAGPGASKPFTLRFPKAGTFTYFCLTHPGMKGVVRVVAKHKKVPSPRLDAQSAKLSLSPLLKRAEKLGAAKSPPLQVYAGNDQAGVAWLRFFPSTLTVKVGQSVKFSMRSTYENHTVTFGPAPYTMALEKSFITPKPNPMGPPTLSVNPLAGYPSDPVLPPFTGANHGNGFENAGVLAGGPGQGLPTKATFTFTKAGTYHFECVIHQGMDGTLTVVS